MRKKKPMADPKFRIAGDLALPVDAVTETFLIFGKRGSGKTTAASVFTEEVIGAGLPVSVIDPMGAWWGLRASADGQGPGLPVTILGGEHADLGLPHDAGAAVADLAVTERLPMVLDLFLMSKTQQRQFVTDFMEHLFRRNREPMHLVVDEADRFAPQRGTAEQARLVGAYEDIVLRGRKPGIGSTSITLRPAQLHSAIRSQVEVLIAMRLLGKLDVNAIDEWIRLHATDEDARELKASLPSLPVGTAWVWSPGWLELLTKVQIRARHTFNSSATPKVGERVIVPREFARVDPADLQRMAALLQPAAPDEPAGGQGNTALRRQVAELRAALTAAGNRAPERIEVPVLGDADREALAGLVRAMQDLGGKLAPLLAQPGRPAIAPPPRAASPAVSRPVAPRAVRPDATPVADAALKPGALRVLGALARRHPLRVTRPQLAALAGMKRTGGAFQSYYSALRGGGFIAEDGGLISVTPEGLAAAGVEAGAEPTAGDDLREMWRGILKPKAWAVLEQLLTVYPETRTKAELAEAVGMTASGGGFQGYLTTLSTNDLVSASGGDLRAAEVFFLEEAPGA